MDTVRTEPEGDIRYYVSVKDAATKLGVSIPCVYWWIKAKRFPHTRILGRIFFTPEQLAQATEIYEANAIR